MLTTQNCVVDCFNRFTDFFSVFQLPEAVRCCIDRSVFGCPHQKGRGESLMFGLPVSEMQLKNSAHEIFV